MEGREQNAYKYCGAAQGQGITHSRPGACQDQNAHMKADPPGR